MLAGGPDRQMYSALTPDGSRVAFGTVTGESDIARPVYVATVPDGHARKLCDDCKGRPRVWLQDGRHLVLERFGRLNSVAVVDTATGGQVDLLVSQARSVSNPRLSADDRWVVFEVREGRSSPATYVAQMDGMRPVPESKWLEIDRDAAVPFWSPDGRLVYYVAGTTIAGQVIRARRFDSTAGRPAGDPFEVYALDGARVPAFLTSGAALLADRDQIVMTLAGFPGDVWITSLPRDR